MKKLGMICLLALLPYCLYAQKKVETEELLDKTLVSLSNKNGVRIDYVGTETGFLLLKGKRFYLNNNHIQCWYDGTTLWSYVDGTNEVNISEPDPEELQSINPYYLLARYKAEYKYDYHGKGKGKKLDGHEILLTPLSSDDSVIYRVYIEDDYEPQGIVIEQNGNTVSEIQITSYKTNQKLEDNMFRFNKTLFPDIEVIDMR